MKEPVRYAEAAIPDLELWEGPWRLSEDELRMHAAVDPRASLATERNDE